MAIISICPNCSRHLELDSDPAGGKIRCPGCQRNFRARIPDGSDRVTSGAAPADPVVECSLPEEPGTGVQDSNDRPVPPGDSFPASDGLAARCTNVGFIRSALVAALITAVLYWIIKSFFRYSYLGKITMDRGKVPVVVVFLAVCSMVVLCIKFLKLKAQQKHLRLEVISGEHPERRAISPGDIDTFLSRIRERKLDPARSFLLNRLVRGMEQFRQRGDVQQVRTLLETQGDLDAAAVDSSYTMLKVIIWSVPILGFIGTVAGIGESVSFFSGVIQGAKDIAEIKGSLGGVTTGLALAFDVTLIALVMSVLLMFPMNWLQKSEEDNLAAIHEYCTQKFLARLSEGDPGAPEEHRGQAEGGEQQSGLPRWMQQLDQAGVNLADRIAGVVNPILDRLEESDRRRTGELERIFVEEGVQRKAFLAEVRPYHQEQVEVLTRASKGFGECVSGIQEEIAELEKRQARGIADLTSLLSANLQAVQDQASRRAEAQLQVLDGVGKRVSASLEGMQWQAEAGLREWSSTWKRAVDAMCENVDRLGRGAGQAEQASVSGLEEARKSVADGLRTLAAGMAEVQTRQERSFEAEIKALKELSEGIAGRLPEEISRQVKALSRVLQGTDKLLNVEQILATNLKALATAEGFKKLFAALGTGVAQLGPILEKLDQRLDDLTASLAVSREFRGWRLPFLTGRKNGNHHHA